MSQETSPMTKRSRSPASDKQEPVVKITKSIDEEVVKLIDEKNISDQNDTSDDEYEEHECVECGAKDNHKEDEIVCCWQCRDCDDYICVNCRPEIVEEWYGVVEEDGSEFIYCSICQIDVARAEWIAEFNDGKISTEDL